jgi:hypothetical protein
MLLIVDPWNYRLYLLLHGIAEAWDFDVERQVADRLHSVLTNAEKDDDNIAPFFCFECNNGQRVAVSVRDIEAVNYLFDASIPLPKKPSIEINEDEEYGDEDLYHVTIYFRNRPQPLERETENREQIDEIFEEMSTDPFGSYRFLTLTDADGELVTFNASHVTLFMVGAEKLTDEADVF